MRIRYCWSILSGFTDDTGLGPPKKIDRGAPWSTPDSCEGTWQSRTLNAHARIRKINLGFDNQVTATIFATWIVTNGLRIILRSSLCGGVLFVTTLSREVNPNCSLVPYLRVNIRRGSLCSSTNASRVSQWFKQGWWDGLMGGATCFSVWQHALRA